MSYTVRRVTEAEWPRYRDIRLRMLADTPLAYNDSLAEAKHYDEATWRERVARTERAGNILLVAEAGDDWLGVMGGWTPDGQPPHLVGVFVDPRFRGRASGVADALLDGIIEWARASSPTLLLHVHETNERAKGFYLRHGFELTGESVPYNLFPYGDEVEMRLDLGAQSA